METAPTPAHPPRTTTRVVRTGTALTLVAAATAAGLLSSSPVAELAAPAAATTEVRATGTDPQDLTVRNGSAERSSRSASRTAAKRKAAKKAPTAVATRYTTVALKVRTAPDLDADVVEVLPARAKVRITSADKGQWQQVVVDGKARWVREDFLARKRPAAQPAEPAGLSGAACATGSGVEAPLVRNAIDVHRAVCARFPQISTYGGYRPGGGYHSRGQALDIMVSGARGLEVARFLQAHAKELGVMELIYQQRIWTVQRASEGWRHMSDRGSATDNHYDHVHVTVYR